MSLKPFVAPAILIVGAPTSDGGMRLRLETQEISNEQKVALLDYNNTFGHFCFSPNPIQEGDIPKEAARREGKTPGERLRGVLYLIYMERGGKKEEFYKYYIEEMEKVISQFKSHIGETF
jgi:hypothetical protein